MLVALAFSAFLTCRYLDAPEQSHASLKQLESKQSLQYGFPFIGSPLSTSNLDQASGRDDVRVRILSAVLRSLFASGADKHHYVPENQTPVTRGQPPIWLINCAMLC
jgi:hypothetical protein